VPPNWLCCSSRPRFQARNAANWLCLTRPVPHALPSLRAAQRRGNPDPENWLCFSSRPHFQARNAENWVCLALLVSLLRRAARGNWLCLTRPVPHALPSLRAAQRRGNPDPQNWLCFSSRPHFQAKNAANWVCLVFLVSLLRTGARGNWLCLAHPASHAPPSSREAKIPAGHIHRPQLVGATPRGCPVPEPGCTCRDRYDSQRSPPTLPCPGSPNTPGPRTAWATAGACPYDTGLGGHNVAMCD